MMTSYVARGLSVICDASGSATTRAASSRGSKSGWRTLRSASPEISTETSAGMAPASALIDAPRTRSRTTGESSGALSASSAAPGSFAANAASASYTRCACASSASYAAVIVASSAPFGVALGTRTWILNSSPPRAMRVASGSNTFTGMARGSPPRARIRFAEQGRHARVRTVCVPSAARERLGVRNQLAHLQPLIEAHADELKQPGVVSIRPGYKMEDGLLTKEPAIVVTVKPGSAPQGIPATVGDVPVDVREADPAEELRFTDPAGYAKLASVRAEFRAGAFEEVDPVAEDAEAAPGVEGAAAVRPQATGKQQPYSAPTGDDGKTVPLAAVTGTFPFTVHASPDAGWPTLKKFLAGTKSSLDVAMYDFTSAHVLEGIESAVAAAQTLTLTLDNPAKNPSADQTDADTLETLGNDVGDRFKSAWALNRANPKINDWIFPNAYHIKVAVRDGDTVWLSSGNWNNSNQPDFDPVNAEDPNASEIQQEAKKRDRDWHIIIEHPEIAKTFQAYVLHDYEVASKDAGADTADTSAVEAQAPFPVVEIEAARKPWKFFAPLRIEDEEVEITPLLTPDPGVYQPAMLALIRSAQKKLYIQLQYIHPSDKEGDEDRS